jgi:hypothetical protein
MCDAQIDSLLAGVSGILIHEMVQIHLGFAQLQVPTNYASSFSAPC